MTQGGGMTLMDEGNFLDWVRRGQIVQIIDRMAQVISVREVVIAITRTYQYDDDTCCEDDVDVY